MTGARRRLADMLAAQSIPAEAEHISDEFNRGVAAALQRRGIITVPGMTTPAEEAQEAHRLRVRAVVDALTPRPPAPPPAPEPEQPARLADQIKALLGQPADDQSHTALNSPELLRRAADSG